MYTSRFVLKKNTDRFIAKCNTQDFVFYAFFQHHSLSQMTTCKPSLPMPWGLHQHNNRPVSFGHTHKKSFFTDSLLLGIKNHLIFIFYWFYHLYRVSEYCNAFITVCFITYCHFRIVNDILNTWELQNCFFKRGNSHTKIIMFLSLYLLFIHLKLYKQIL